MMLSHRDIPFPISEPPFVIPASRERRLISKGHI